MVGFIGFFLIIHWLFIILDSSMIYCGFSDNELRSLCYTDNNRYGNQKTYEHSISENISFFCELIHFISYELNDNTTL